MFDWGWAGAAAFLQSRSRGKILPDVHTFMKEAGCMGSSSASETSHAPKRSAMLDTELQILHAIERRGFERLMPGWPRCVCVCVPVAPSCCAAAAVRVEAHGS